jgi:uncharacterized membrane protein
MTTDTNPWAQAYLTDLDRAALTLPADRRAELREQITAHLADEMGGATDSDQARAALARLGDPADLVAEAAADLSPASSTATRPSGAEIVALLLMGIGGIVFPLIAPAIGVVIMRSTPRWTTGQVRVSWGILSVGLLAALGLLGLATIPNAPGWAVLTAVVLLAVLIMVGPAAALYAGTRPRPGHA